TASTPGLSAPHGGLRTAAGYGVAAPGARAARLRRRGGGRGARGASTPTGDRFRPGTRPGIMRSPTEGVQLRNTLNLLLGIAVSLGCLYLATRGTDWAGVAAVLRGARPFWVLAISVVGLVSLTVRAQRWRLLLRPLGDVPLAQAISATAIGF